ncbi:MAG: DUF192 domain-containing protein [Actinomycetales bacterium]|nr:DUF192 domain-containing protein [Actinomycetales bacterium]
MTESDARPTCGPGVGLLLREGREIAPLVVAATAAERRRGLLGTDALVGALWLQPCSSVHCVGMRYPIDVALLNRRGRVLAVRTLRPGRMTMPSPRVRAVVEAPAGAMAEWGIRRGDVLSRRNGTETDLDQG